MSGAEFDATVQTPQADPQPHSQRIPKQLHRIWVGPNPLPNAAVVLWEGFRALHPDWELTTWTEPIDPAAYELGRLFRSCQHPAQLADLLRIELLWQHGGVYVDVDCEAIRPFDPLLEHLLFIGANQGELQNAVIGSIPGHPGLRDVMDTLLEHKVLPPISVNEATGVSRGIRGQRRVRRSSRHRGYTGCANRGLGPSRPGTCCTVRQWLGRTPRRRRPCSGTPRNSRVR